jgi:hypothetical protein
MPKAAVHKDSDLGPSEDDVGSAAAKDRNLRSTSVTHRTQASSEFKFARCIAEASRDHPAPGRVR